jgi:hypothetical protein
MGCSCPTSGSHDGAPAPSSVNGRESPVRVLIKCVGSAIGGGCRLFPAARPARGAGAEAAWEPRVIFRRPLSPHAPLSPGWRRTRAAPMISTQPSACAATVPPWVAPAGACRSWRSGGDA